MRIAVLGAGAWGTALAVAAAARHEVRLYARDAIQAAQIGARRENVRYLPGVALPATLTVTADLQDAVAGAELLVVATPVSGLRPTLAALRATSAPVPVVWLCK
ncbi:MAG: NAD(P)-binding domain-containing protein, partial [Burkholderiaceae bacterium]|nr:NAD(P)-binding domain-containing protein [Burkholderiaceae bacterium]